MNEPLSSLELLSEEEGGANLTYFAFAAPTASAPDLPAVLPGPLPDVLSGRYRLERMLGAGGMGTVYRARDLLHEQFGDPAPLVALKLLNESVAESPDASALLYSEFALTRRLRHPNVVRLFTFDVDTACQRAYIVMELMPGLPLDRLLCERPEGLPWSELSAIARPLLDALAYVHEQGVLHGDLKPSNVMLGEEGVRLFDFGLGQAQAGILDGLPQLSRGRIDAWTPSYAAPELLEGAPLSPAADLYALACVLYELADGRHPFRRLPSNQAREQGLERQLRAPGHLPRRCWPALRTALSLDPERRCIGVRELQEALGARRSWLAGVLAR
ncbi:TPA: serine/threonine protein kinase [Pseudomonas aeruginosa]|uniref:serine/threonine-protein kinase n=1 Tax=Pseudomonas aeruginosa TaxID=287 RepID=UPI0004525F25|nr:serine/threonine-protein kinase [Pseudomonas aeruginosa]EZO94939.1 serine-threonine kinase Stk1 [Pseudomonas aeruginosa BWH054]KSH50381.1 serine/threonine protein kinase [Pseudomonas aeruginosa]MBT1077669.1 serine/threonine protein kinase [Pseudomonas aeruginosa]HBP5658076.1 serine/threonine protein kinase [Pseudomonas aeruginosa]HCE7096741.1 serine/threonine protein kinase [Pseudomonas aeruginosa]